MIENYVTVAEAARSKGVNVETIRRWIKTGALRAIKAGQTYLVRAEDLDAITPSRRGRPQLREMIRQIIREELSAMKDQSNL